jgi:small-conductance mechanosensitive channel
MDKVLDILLNRKLIYTIIIIIVAVVLYLIFSSLINKLVKVKLKGVRIDERRHKTTLSLLKNLVKYFIAIIALLMIMDTYGIDTKSLIASLGVVSLVAGLALQDFLKDIIAGITIIFEDQYAVGDVVTVKISNLAPFGAFAKIDKGIEGLIHISQICEKRITKPEEVLKIGQKVNAKIISIDVENKKIELSIRELEGTSDELETEVYEETAVVPAEEKAIETKGETAVVETPVEKNLVQTEVEEEQSTEETTTEE